MDIDIGRAVRVCNAAKGWTSKSLASKCDVSPSTISLVESGERKPSIDLLIAIVRAFEINPAYFMVLTADRETLEATPGPVCAEVVRWLISA